MMRFLTHRSLRRIMNETDFTGVSGRVRFAVGGASRSSEIQIHQFIINKTDDVVGVFPPYDDHLKQPVINRKYADIPIDIPARYRFWVPFQQGPAQKKYLKIILYCAFHSEVYRVT